MQPTNRLRTITIATCATLVLVLTGIRCTSTPQPAPADTPKIPVYTQKRVIDRVDWPASSTINQTALKAMKPEEALKITSSGVPVLVPSDPVLLGQGLVWTETTTYGFALPDPVNGLMLTLTAGRVSVKTDQPFPARAYESDPSALDLRGTKVSFRSGEAVMRRAMWVENGEAWYMLDVDCLTPTDPRCTNDDYIADLVKNLVYVGGNGQ